MKYSFVIICFCVSLIGCQANPFVVLDTKTHELIKQRWQQSVGHTTDRDNKPLKTPTTAKVTQAKDYATTLATLNPTTTNLSTQRDRLPFDAAKQMLDDLAILEEKAPAMGLDQLLAYAVTYGREYRNEKETLFIASLNLLRERHLWGPRFFNSVTANFSGTPEGGDHDQAFDLINRFTVSQKLPNGGKISVDAVVNFVDMLRSASSNSSQSASTTLSASIPLLRGSGLVARESLIQRERNLIYATRTFERFRRRFLLRIATNYYDLLQQQAGIKNLQRQLKSFQWLSSRIDALARAGRQPQFEVQRATQQLLFARNNLSNSLENYQQRLDAFRIQIGMPVGKPLAIKPTQVIVAKPVLEVNHAVKTALQYRLDLQTIEDRLGDQRRAVSIAKQNLKGDLNFDASLGFQTQANKKNAGLDFEIGDSSYSLGLTYDMPLDRQIEKIDYRRALVNLAKSRRDFSLEKDRVAQQVRSSIRRIRQSRFTLFLQKQNIEVASKRLRGVVLRLRQLGPRDFIEAQNDLLEAKNRKDAAERDWRVSVLQYLLDTGQMRVSAQGHWLPPAQLVAVNSLDPKDLPSQLISQPSSKQIVPQANTQ